MEIFENTEVIILEQNNGNILKKFNEILRDNPVEQEIVWNFSPSNEYDYLMKANNMLSNNFESFFNKRGKKDILEKILFLESILLKMEDKNIEYIHINKTLNELYNMLDYNTDTNVELLERSLVTGEDIYNASRITMSKIKNRRK